MKKLTKLEKFGLIAAILVGGTYFYMKEVYDPEAASLKSTIETLNKTVTTFNGLSDPPAISPLRRQVESLKERLATEIERLREAGGRTGEEAEVTEVLRLINDTAGRQRIDIIQIEPLADIEEELFTWAAFEVKMRCRYPDLLALITRLKELKEPIEIRGLHIAREPGAGGYVVVRMKLLV